MGLCEEGRWERVGSESGRMLMSGLAGFERLRGRRLSWISSRITRCVSSLFSLVGCSVLVSVGGCGLQGRMDGCGGGGGKGNMGCGDEAAMQGGFICCIGFTLLRNRNTQSARRDRSNEPANSRRKTQVSRIKERVEEKEGIPPAQQRLIFGGKQMYVFPFPFPVPLPLSVSSGAIK